ncbi:MAG: hypothetical protein RL689_2057, partial [Planctomycetota bacterium]
DSGYGDAQACADAKKLQVPMRSW